MVGAYQDPFLLRVFLKKIFGILIPEYWAFRTRRSSYPSFTIFFSLFSYIVSEIPCFIFRIVVFGLDYICPFVLHIGVSFYSKRLANCISFSSSSIFFDLLDSYDISFDLVSSYFGSSSFFWITCSYSRILQPG